MGKHNFFFFFGFCCMIGDTRELLKRKNMELQDHNCVLCSWNLEENLVHLFFDSPFSKW
jgi:hypothetical protein